MMEVRTMIVGKHFIADLYGVDPKIISTEENVRPIVEKVIAHTGLNKVNSLYNQFNPHGVTGLILISESHISVHTWPEYELVSLEIFTCGDTEQAEKAFNLLIEEFNPESYNSHVLNRGW